MRLTELDRKAIPWILVLFAAFVALWGIAVSAPTACNDLPSAFREGVTTTQSNVLGGFVADRCETVRGSDGFTQQVTLVNWSGLIAGVALVIGAWLMGAALVGRVKPQTGAIGVGVSAVVLFAAVAAFFL